MTAAATSAWWTPASRARSLQAYRIAVGALLALHFSSRIHAGASSVASFALVACGAAAISAGFGLWPRTTAWAGFALSRWLLHGGSLPATLDDAFAGIALFWLGLLPAPGGRREGVEGWTTAALLFHLWTLHLDMRLWSAFAPAWPESPLVALAFAAIAPMLIVPSAALRVPAAILLLLLHLWLSTQSGLHFAHWLFAASALLFWGPAEDGRIAHPLGVRAALGAAVVAVTLVFVIAQRAEASSTRRACVGVLWDTGLLPFAAGGAATVAADRKDLER